MQKMYMLLPLFLILIVGFNVGDSEEIPADVERVNMKLSDNEIAITFFALPSGEATLIQHAIAGNIMINTGGPETQTELDLLLKMYNINELNAIILTNDTPEYNSNLNWLTKNFKDAELIMGNQNFNKWKHQSDKKISIWKQNEQYEILPKLLITVIHDQIKLNENEGLDLSLKYGNHHILYMSTANKNIEYELAKKDLADVNILKVADFASNKGTSEIFLNSVDPQVAVIFKKKGTLPSQAVIERLQETWIDIYQTNQFGNISIKCSPERYEVITIPVANVPEE